MLKGAKKRDISESDTVVMIGDMLADILGYEKYNEISTEFAVKGTYVDLCVKVGNEVHFLVEAKAIGVDLKDNHVKQAIDYGANQGIEWAILTNGAIWRIYRIEFKKPISHVLVAEIDMLADPFAKDQAVEFFANLCKEGFEKSQMEEFFERRQATNAHSLAAILLTDDMVDELRLTLRRLFPGVKVDVDALQQSLRQDVIKRELIDGEEAEIASDFIKKAIRSFTRAKSKKGGDAGPVTKAAAPTSVSATTTASD